MTRLAFHALLLPVFVKDILKDLSQILCSYSVGLCICPPATFFFFFLKKSPAHWCLQKYLIFEKIMFLIIIHQHFDIMLTIYSLNQPCIWLTSPLSVFFQSTAVEWGYCVRAAAADLQWKLNWFRKRKTASFRPVVIIFNYQYTPYLTTVAL